MSISHLPSGGFVSSRLFLCSEGDWEQWRQFSSPLLIMSLSGATLTARFLHSQFKVADQPFRTHAKSCSAILQSGVWILWLNHCSVTTEWFEPTDIYLTSAKKKDGLGWWPSQMICCVFSQGTKALHRLTDQQINFRLKYHDCPRKCVNLPKYWSIKSLVCKGRNVENIAF